MKNIIIFGAGEFGKDAYQFYRLQESVNITAFSDNDSKKHNTLLFGTKIIAPKQIPSTGYDEVVIASSFDDEIYKQLIEMGIENDKIKVLNLNQIKIQLSNGYKLLLAEQLMLDISDILNKKGIEYHIDHGTLLGVVRDNSLMPWDIDVDFACLSSDKEILQSVLDEFLKNYESNYCQINNWRCSISKCKMVLDNKELELPMVIKVFNDAEDITSNSFFVDIELKYKHKDNLYWMVGSRKLSMPYSHCFPADSITFKNHKIKTPKETTKYLTLLYGNWKEVVKEWSYNRYENICG